MATGREGEITVSTVIGIISSLSIINSTAGMSKTAPPSVIISATRLTVFVTVSISTISLMSVMTEFIRPSDSTSNVKFEEMSVTVGF